MSLQFNFCPQIAHSIVHSSLHPGIASGTSAWNTENLLMSSVSSCNLTDGVIGVRWGGPSQPKFSLCLLHWSWVRSADTVAVSVCLYTDPSLQVINPDGMVRTPLITLSIKNLEKCSVVYVSSISRWIWARHSRQCRHYFNRTSNLFAFVWWNY